MRRKLSLVLALLAFITVPLWAYLQGGGVLAEQIETGGYACGMPILGLYLLALLISGLLSLGSVILGALAYQSLPQPRPKRRIAELLIVSLPMLLALAVTTMLVATGI